MKGIQSYLYEKRSYIGNFGSRSFMHLEDYKGFRTCSDVSEIDIISFFCFSSPDVSDARHYYDSVFTRNMDLISSMKWNLLVAFFRSSYISITK